MNNKPMVVKIGDFGSLNIGHKTQFGKAADIMAMGNTIREINGQRTIKLEEILRKRDFWEFALVRNAAIMSDNLKSENDETLLKTTSADSADVDSIGFTVYPDFTKLDDYKNKDGKMEYGKLIKEMPLVIRSHKRGKLENQGTWMNLYLLLKLATYLDKVLEHEIYDCFVKGKILDYRDDGGERFKDLNDAIHERLQDLGGKFRDRELYISLACILRDKIKPDGNDWNTATKVQLAFRNQYEKTLIDFLRAGLVKDGNHLKQLAKQL